MEDSGGQLWVKGGCGLQVDGTAGLPSAPEMPCAARQLSLVPQADLLYRWPRASMSLMLLEALNDTLLSV